jgi:hypothetical protein
VASRPSDAARKAQLARRLHAAADDALREFPWPELAAFIDEIHQEQERFYTLINRREIGAHVPVVSRGYALDSIKELRRVSA